MKEFCRYDFCEFQDRYTPCVVQCLFFLLAHCIKIGYLRNWSQV